MKVPLMSARPKAVTTGPVSAGGVTTGVGGDDGVDVGGIVSVAGGTVGPVPVVAVPVGATENVTVGGALGVGDAGAIGDAVRVKVGALVAVAVLPIGRVFVGVTAAGAGSVPPPPPPPQAATPPSTTNRVDQTAKRCAEPF